MSVTACKNLQLRPCGQGYDGSAVRAALRDAREAAVHETGGMTAADARARMLPNAYVRLHSPPRVPLELTGAARNAAVALALVRRISTISVSRVAACDRSRHVFSFQAVRAGC